MTTVHEMTPTERGRGHDAAIAGRRIGASLSRRRAGGRDSSNPTTWGKVEVYNALRLAARSLGLNRTDLALMWALLNIRPEQVMRPDPDGRVVIFASNATLRSRLNVQADSTISRAVQKLEKAGLVLRHMSPNRKRYRVPDASGGTALAFGIDIWPFWLARERIASAARETSARTAEHRLGLARLRAAIARAETIDPPCSDRQAAIQGARALLRRRAEPAAINQVAASLEAISASGPTKQTAPAVSLHDTDKQFARHNEDGETEERSPNAADPAQMERAFPKVTRLVRDVAARQRNEPLATTLQLVALGLGISRESWHHATHQIGPIPALACLGRIAEDPEVIERPSAYFAALVSRLATGQTTMAAILYRRPKGERRTRSGCSSIASRATYLPPPQPKETVI